MEILNLQFAGVAFILAMLYMTFLFYKQNNYSKGSFLFWMAVWLAGLLLIMFPAAFNMVTERLEMGRVTDLYITIAIMFFGAVTFLNFVHMQRQERKMEELVRKVALLQPKKKK